MNGLSSSSVSSGIRYQARSSIATELKSKKGVERANLYSKDAGAKVSFVRVGFRPGDSAETAEVSLLAYADMFDKKPAKKVKKATKAVAKTSDAKKVVVFTTLSGKTKFSPTTGKLSTLRGTYQMALNSKTSVWQGEARGIKVHITLKKVVGKLIYWA